ncbi:MAG: hypothetical protein RR085_03630, partial [Clostridia bacterium]
AREDDFDDAQSGSHAFGCGSVAFFTLRIPFFAKCRGFISTIIDGATDRALFCCKSFYAMEIPFCYAGSLDSFTA